MDALPWPLRALLVDLDGTLVDSLPVLYGVYERFLAQHGVRPDPDEFTSLNGPPIPRVVELLVERHGLRGSVRELAARYQAEIEACYVPGVQPVHGAAELLAEVRARGGRLALVTGAARALAEAVLARFGWGPLFDAVVCGDDVARGKPDPECFALARRRLGVLEEEALAVDDAPAGVAAAHDAGLETLGLARALPASALLAAGADATVPDLHALRAELTRRSAAAEAAPRVRVLHRGPLELRWREPRDAAAETELVERTWAEALARPGSRLHDGGVCSLVERRGAALTGEYVPYRRYFAQRRTSTDLGVRALGVSGVIAWTGDGAPELLFARRAAWVTAFPRSLELVPSGSLDRATAGADGIVTWREKLLEELHEEAGVSPAAVAEVRPFAVLYDVAERVADLCAELRIGGTRDALLAGFAAVSEYTDPVLVPASALPAFLERHASELVPASAVAAAEWLRGGIDTGTPR